MQQTEKIIRLGHTVVLTGRSAIGAYETGDGGVIIIDTGSGEDGLPLKEYLEDCRLHPLMILNTHSHADHMYGNIGLTRKYGISAYSSAGEARAAAEPQRQYDRICGATPSPHMLEQLLPLFPVRLQDISQLVLPEGFRICSVPGHSVDDIAIRTPDGVWFLGDSLLSMHALALCTLSYVTNFRKYRNSLRVIQGLEGELFVPGHGHPEENGHMLAERNLAHLESLTEFLTEYCTAPRSIEELIAFIMQREENDQLSRYLSLRTSLMTMLCFMEEQGVLRFFVDRGRLLWQTNCF